MKNWRQYRILKWLVPRILLLLLVIFVAGSLLLSTTTGLRLALAIATGLEPRLELELRDGDLLSGIELDRLSWQDDGVRIEASDLRARWLAGCLWRRRLCIRHVHVDHLSVKLSADPKSVSPARTQLPALTAPLPVRIDELQLQSLEFGSDSMTAIGDISLRAAWEDEFVQLEQFRARYQDVQLQVDGHVQLVDDYPLQASANVTNGELDRLALVISGNLGAAGLEITTEGRLELDANIKADLLAPGLPLQGMVSARSPLQVDIPGQGILKAESVRAAMHGNLDQLQASLQTVLTTPWIEPGPAELELLWDGQHVLVPTLQLRTGNGSLTGSGQLGIDAERPWRLTLHGSEISPRPGMLTQTLIVSGTIEANGTASAAPVVNAELDLALELDGLSGQLQGLLQYREDGAVAARELLLLIGDNRLRVAGLFGEQLELQTEFQLTDLGQILPGAAGQAEGKLELSGPRRWPLPSGEASARGLRHGDWRLDSLSLQAAPRSVTFNAAGLRSGNQQIDELRLELQGDALQQALHASALAPEVGELQLDCEGRLAANNDWSGVCARLQLRADAVAAAEAWRSEDDLDVQWLHEPGRLQVSAFCLVNQDTRLCQRENLSISSTEFAGVNIDLKALPVSWLLESRPEALVANGTMSLELAGDWIPGQAPKLSGTLWIPRLDCHFPEQPEVPLPPVQELQAQLEIADDQLLSAVKLRVGETARLAGELKVEDLGAERSLTGRFELSALQLAALSAFDPQTEEVSGRLDGDLALDGSLGHPTISGEISLSEGLIAHQQLPEALENIQARLSFDGRQASIAGSLDSAGGSGTFAGELGWQDVDDWQATLRTSLQGLKIRPLPDSEVELSPEIELQLTPGKMGISGSVAVPSARLVLESLPPSAETVSRDTVIIGGSDTETVSWDWRLGMDISIGDDVRMRGYGAEAQLGGGLKLSGDSRNPLAGDGEIQIVEGRYEAYGQRLRVTHGSLLFHGALGNPDIRLEAVRDLDDDSTTVGIRASGPARNPDLEVFSIPTMPQSAAIQFLVTGQPPDSNSVSSEDMLNTALIGVGAAHATRGLGDAAGNIGIEDFRISTASGDAGSEVQLSGYITPDLFLRYGMGIHDRINTLRLRYRLRPRLHVELISGLEQAVDLIYSFER